MTKSYSNIEWICHLHDNLNVDYDKDITWLQKHYGHKVEAYEKKLVELNTIYDMAHEMLDHLHISSTSAGNMVMIPL